MEFQKAGTLQENFLETMIQQNSCRFVGSCVIV